jgi:hypothetical protein
MQKSDRIHIPMRVALVMVRNYAQVKVMEQVKSVAFIILYLIGFQILVLKTAPANALQISLGIGMVIFGLTFFLEGLFYRVDAAGERVGVQLPNTAASQLSSLSVCCLGWAQPSRSRRLLPCAWRD